MLGTRGVPARYGGFETCVEEVGSRLAARGHQVLVYCRDQTGERPETHRGMRLVYEPAVRRRAWETISHSAFSVGHLVRHPADVAFVFNAANAPLLPVLRARRIPVACHVDGLEWQRAKWSGLGQRYYRVMEGAAVRYSDAIIADSPVIAAYYERSFGAPSVEIAYGAKQTRVEDTSRLAGLGLTPGSFHVAVARFEPENNLELIVGGYTRSRATLPLIVVGAAAYGTEYTERVRALADGRTRFLGPVWDSDLLDDLYGGALTYVHGHSVGGTNPSLLRAMGAGAAVLAYDVEFNRYPLGPAGRFFADENDLARLLEAAEADPDETRRRGAQSRVESHRYTWDDVADRYERLAAQLPALRGRPRPSGRRRRA